MALKLEPLTCFAQLDNYLNEVACKFIYPGPGSQDEVKNNALDDVDDFHSTTFLKGPYDDVNHIVVPYPNLDENEFAQYNIEYKETAVCQKQAWALNILDYLCHSMFGKTMMLERPKVGDYICLLNDLVVNVAGVNYVQTDYGFRTPSMEFSYDSSNKIELMFSTKSFSVYRLMPGKGDNFRHYSSRLLMKTLFTSAQVVSAVIAGVASIKAPKLAVLGVLSGLGCACAASLCKTDLCFNIGPKHTVVLTNNSAEVSLWKRLTCNYRVSMTVLPNVLVNQSIQALSGVKDDESAKRKISTFTSRLAKSYEENGLFSRYLRPLNHIALNVWESTTNFKNPDQIVEYPKAIYGKCQGVAEGVELKPGAKIYTQVLDDMCEDNEVRAWGYFKSNFDRLYYPKNCTHNAHRALVNRILKKFRSGCKITMNRLRDFVKRMLPKLIPVSQVEVISYDDWYHHCSSKQRGRYVYLDYETQMDCAIDALKVKGFVKHEAHFKEDFIGRIISGRSDEYATQLGPYTYTASKILQSCWSYRDKGCPYAEVDKNNLCDKILYAAGENRDSMGAWMQLILDTFDDPVFLSTDYSKFDAHISTVHLLVEQLLYEYLFPGNTDVQSMLRSQLHSFGSIQAKDGNIDYCVDGTRKSGDPNTSVGNSFLNAMIQLFVIDQFDSVEKLMEENRLRISVMGDDTIIAFDGYYVDQVEYEEWMARCGMEVEASYGDVSQVKFCSSMFVPCDRSDGVSTYVMCPLPGRQLIKSGCSIHKYSGRAIADWIATNSLAMRQDLSCLPFISCFYDRVFKSQKGKIKSTFIDRHWNTEFNYTCTDDTRSWFKLRYGFRESELTELGKVLDTTNPDLEHQLVRCLYDVDIDEVFPNTFMLNGYLCLHSIVPQRPLKDLEEIPVNKGDLNLNNIQFNDRSSSGIPYFPVSPVIAPRPKLFKPKESLEVAQELREQYGMSNKVFNKISAGKGGRFRAAKNAKKKSKFAGVRADRRKGDFMKDRGNFSGPKSSGKKSGPNNKKYKGKGNKRTRAHRQDRRNKAFCLVPNSTGQHFNDDFCC